MTETASNNSLLQQLAQFRAELVELALAMDRRGQPEAADVAMMVFARMGELCEEYRTDRPICIPVSP
ncbi:MAG TPA: hypothetical protein VGM64_09175 [Lacunisphaera sp.]|jgi:hypothetical protein